MSARQPITIGREHFPSKTAAKKRFSEILNSYEGRLGTPIAKDDQDMVMDLLQLYKVPAAKIGSGIQRWTVEENGPRNGGAHLGFYLHRTDGSEDDFGFGKVIDGDTTKRRVRGALANSIRQITQKVRREAFEHPPVTCAKTKAVIPDLKSAMVVHRKPKWGKLCDDFVKRHGGYDNIRLETREGYHGQCLADEAVAKAFRKYQRRRLGGLEIILNPSTRW